MTWNILLSSIVASGVVSALVSWLFGWHRSWIESRWRRNEERRTHLRDALISFITADEARYQADGEYQAEAEYYHAVRKDGDDRPPDQRELQDASYFASWRADSEAKKKVQNLLVRLRLYSPAIYAQAAALTKVQHDIPDDPLVEEDPADSVYEEQLARLLDTARADLGIDRL